MRAPAVSTAAGAFFLLLLSVVTSAAAAASQPPNIVLIVADDLGYGDIGVNGAELIATPRLDRMARDGVRFTDFHASANVCTPSRAGIMTGRYAIRSGLGWQVIEADDERGLPAAELTLPELLQSAGYRTALIGKWHLGNRPPYWPTRHGYDEFLGLLHSNDMQPLVLYRGEEAIEEPVAQATLTRRYTAELQRLIEEAGEQPFFVLLAHTFPHIPLHASEEFVGRSRAGLYGDTVEEIDWSTGEILDALQAAGLDEQTLVLFTSDNGAWFEGDNGRFREGKGTTWDGAYRVPLIARWPGQIPAGVVSDALSMNIDLLPTLAAIADVALPDGLLLDGRDLQAQLRGADDSPHEVLYFFDNEDIAAIRTPRWKLMLRSYYRRNLAAFERFEKGIGFSYWLLFDMQSARPERYSVAREHPQVLAGLLARWQAAREEFEPLRTQPPPAVLP